MQHNPQFNAQSPDQARTHFLLSNNCTVETVDYWATLIVDRNSNPQTIFSQTVAFARGLFNQGKCTKQ